MPNWFVSEAFNHLWITDTPIQYSPAYGPEIRLKLAYNVHNDTSLISLSETHGATMGNSITPTGGAGEGLWSCSWFAFAELANGDGTLEVSMPGGGWATFSFQAGSDVSDMEYFRNIWAEKMGPAGGVTNIVVHVLDGSTYIYGLNDSNTAGAGGYAGLFYITKACDPTGVGTAFSYDQNFYLTNVAAADGASFTLHYGSGSIPNLVTSITSSYGASVSLGYSTPDQYSSYALTNIVDAGGITSDFAYANVDAVTGATMGGAVTNLITPYGTTQFATGGYTVHNPIVFDSYIRVTLPNGTQELFGQLRTYTGSDWTNDFQSWQIPTNTPLGTLDSAAGDRQERNTIFWNAQQFAPYVNTAYTDFNWSAFKMGQIRHWLGTTDPQYTHWSTLSLEQEPSPGRYYRRRDCMVRLRWQTNRPNRRERNRNPALRHRPRDA
jgi:hypothetical protein